MNNSRQLYQKILGHKKSQDDKARVIQESKDLKDMLDMGGWKLVKNFLDKQKAGSNAFMDHEVGNINTFSLLGLFNTYIKYLFFLMERRAYRKVETFISVTIKNGEKYEEEFARREAKKGKS